MGAAVLAMAGSYFDTHIFMKLVCGALYRFVTFKDTIVQLNDSMYNNTLYNQHYLTPIL